jgi:hypothetical protein
MNVLETFPFEIFLIVYVAGFATGVAVGFYYGLRLNMMRSGKCR